MQRNWELIGKLQKTENPEEKTAGKKANSEEFAEQKEKIVLIKDWLYRNNF